jgi:hypothetical protein
MGNPFESADREDEEFVHSIEEWRASRGINRPRHVLNPDQSICAKCGMSTFRDDDPEPWCVWCDFDPRKEGA